MALFSQRKGIRPLEKALQREEMDLELRNRIWSGLKVCIWDKWETQSPIGIMTPDAQQVEDIVKNLWLNHFKKPIDTIPQFLNDYPSSAYQIIRDHFLNGEWWEAYDLIEFLVKTIPESWKEELKPILNKFLEEENSAYRLVDNEIVEITSEHEVKAVEEAISSNSNSITTHLTQALNLLSDRQNPDYRNSIKESIAAVEAACQRFSGESKATLSECIKKVKTSGHMHSAFEQALLKLYGYSSDSGGIRHALTEQDTDPSFADAKFMLVACSAFVNFLWTRSSELGIDTSS